MGKVPAKPGSKRLVDGSPVAQPEAAGVALEPAESMETEDEDQAAADDAGSTPACWTMVAWSCCLHDVACTDDFGA